MTFDPAEIAHTGAFISIDGNGVDPVKAFGEELLDGMQKSEEQFTEVRYTFPKPGADKTPGS